MSKRYGKYRGVVESDSDPLAIGRLLVSVPQVQSGTSTWAMPCLPPPSPGGSGWVLPAPGSGVWVEFEEGDVEHPIWTGCWYRTPAEAPPFLPRAAGEPNLAESGEAAEVVLRVEDGALISISSAGITLSNGKGATLELKGPTVSINGDALAVT